MRKNTKKILITLVASLSLCAPVLASTIVNPRPAVTVNAARRHHHIRRYYSYRYSLRAQRRAARRAARHARRIARQRAAQARAQRRAARRAARRLARHNHALKIHEHKIQMQAIHAQMKAVRAQRRANKRAAKRAARQAAANYSNAAENNTIKKGNIIFRFRGHKYSVPADAEGNYGKVNIHHFFQGLRIFYPELHARGAGNSNHPFVPFITGDASGYGSYTSAVTKPKIWNKYYARLPFKDYMGKMNILINESGGEYRADNPDGRFQITTMPRKYSGSSYHDQLKQEKFAIHYLHHKGIKNWYQAGYKECREGY